MKRKLCFVFAMVCVMSWIFQITVWASDVSLFNNNTLATKSKFTISDTGEAIVTVNYEGYIDITTGATITIKLEKRSFLLFWNDIRHKNEAYAKALANSNALKKAATETAKGQARKLANQVAKNAAKVTADVYYEQSLVQLGKNLVTAPASVAITTVVDYANN